MDWQIEGVHGMILITEIQKFSELPESEMAEVWESEISPGNLAYPYIIPALRRENKNKDCII